MSLSKSETDSLILTQNQPINHTPDNINELHYRSTDSVHPPDCKCDLCRELRFSDAGGAKDLQTRKDLNWYTPET